MRECEPKVALAREGEQRPHFFKINKRHRTKIQEKGRKEREKERKGDERRGEVNRNYNYASTRKHHQGRQQTATAPDGARLEPEPDRPRRSCRIDVFGGSGSRRAGRERAEPWTTACFDRSCNGEKGGCRWRWSPC